MMSYNSRPPGGGVGIGASSSTRRALPTSVQPIQNTQRIRIDNDETESLYTSPSATAKLGSPALPSSPRHQNNNNSNKPQQTLTSTDRLSPVDYNNTTPTLASSQRRKSSNGASTAPTKTLVILNSSDTSLSHVKRQWLRAFEAMRYDLPSVSTLI